MIFMLILHCAFIMVIFMHCCKLFSSPSSRKATDRATWVSLNLLLVVQLITVWNEATLIRGDFTYCMSKFELRYGLSNILLSFLCILILFGYHNACSQVYNFSVHKRLITTREKNTKYCIFVIIISMSIVTLLAWVLAVSLYRPSS